MSTKIILGDLTEIEAKALVRLMRQLRLDHLRAIATDDQDLWVLDAAALKLMRALVAAGFDPRTAHLR